MVDQAIYVIIDGSGSMSAIKQDVVKGINEFIKEQQDDVKASGEDVKFSLTTFDTNVMEVYIKENISLVNPVTIKETFLGGGTALLDAIGQTLTNAEDVQADRNLVVIYTDGEENSSREFDKDDIEKLIEKLSNTGKWQFVYLGAEFAEFTEDAAFGAVGSAASGTFSALNTGKGSVTDTWRNVSRTSTMYRGMSHAAMDSLDSERSLLDVAQEDGVDWDAVEDKETTSTS